MVEAAQTSSPLTRAARLVAGLRPDWRDAEAFYLRRAEALACLRAAAAPGRTRDKPPCRWPEALPEAPAAPTGFLGPPRGSLLACNLCGWPRRS
jgi:hypothetical protein